MQEKHELAVLKLVFRQLLLDHPLPWRTEQDWATEVTAKDGTVILKCNNDETAKAIIKYAEEYQRQLDIEAEKDKPIIEEVFQEVIN